MTRDPHEERSAYVGGDHVERLRKLDGEEVLSGVVYLFGRCCRAWFIRVHLGAGAELAPVCDPHDRFDVALRAEPEGPLRPIRVPGFEGEYVFFVSPGVE